MHLCHYQRRVKKKGEEDSLSHSFSSNSIVDNTNNNRISIQSRLSIDAPSSIDAKYYTNNSNDEKDYLSEAENNIDNVHLFEIHDSWLTASNDSNDSNDRSSHIIMDDGGGLLKLKEKVCNDVIVMRVSKNIIARYFIYTLYPNTYGKHLYR